MNRSSRSSKRASLNGSGLVSELSTVISRAIRLVKRNVFTTSAIILSMCDAQTSYPVFTEDTYKKRPVLHFYCLRSNILTQLSANYHVDS